MPGLDQTGPVGQGPMTGRRMGRCTNLGANVKRTEETPSGGQEFNPEDNFPGRGFGFGWRRGSPRPAARGHWNPWRR